MPATSRLRVLLLAAAVGVAALAVAVQLYTFQVLRAEGLRARALEQHRTRVIVPAMRGTITDRNGIVLALSTEARSLYAHPGRVANAARAADKLAPVLGQRRAAILGELRSDKPFVYLARFLEPEVAERVSRLGLELGGTEPFGFETEPRRVYPRAETAVHVVGFATIDGDGVEGVEAVLDDELRGDPRVYVLFRDAHARGLRQLASEGRKKASDVVLTLDVVLQHLVETELDRAMRESRSAAASAVMLDPATGEILALANRPAADANRYGRADAEARRNRAVVDRFEPGSTFKIVPLAAALEAGKIRPDVPIFCERGVYRANGRVIHDVAPHGALTPEEILTKSSNIGMVKIAMTLTRRELSEMIERFGFGERTGVELPGENRGFVRPPSQWSAFSQGSLAFGQEIGVTALQLASAFAAVAHDGVLVPPRVILGTRDREGSLVRRSAPDARRVVGPATARAITAMLENVVEEGTGRRASVPGYRIAGKSGTAQKPLEKGGGYSDSDYMASFAGFAPAGRPRLVLLVVLDSPRGGGYYGGEVAAPVFARIMTEALRYLRVPADEPYVPPEAPEPSASQLLVAQTRPARPEHGVAEAPPIPVGEGFTPDVLGLDLRRAVATLAARGCHPRVEGRGIVQSQDPSPGSPLERGAACSIVLGEAQVPAQPGPARDSGRIAS